MRDGLQSVRRLDDVKPGIIAVKTGNNSFYDIYGQEPKEIKRLKLQRSIFKKFDENVYSDILGEQLINDKENLKILEIGSGSFLEYFDNTVNFQAWLEDLTGSTKKYLPRYIEERSFLNSLNNYVKEKGISYIYVSIDKTHTSSICCDREGNSYHFIKEKKKKKGAPIIPDCLINLELEKFDIINMSMIALHLENIEIVLSELKRLLTQNGVIIIEDVDDGLNYVYPDLEINSCDFFFNRLFRICEKETYSGNRKMGRRLYSLLSEANFNNIKKKKTGFSTSDVNEEDKLDFCRIYYDMVWNDLKCIRREFYDKQSVYYENEDKRCELYRNPWEFEEDYDWCKKQFNSKNIKKIENHIRRGNFIFHLGLQIYTAINKIN